MIKDIICSGFCPEQQENYSISIRFEWTGSLESASSVDKLRFRCDYERDFGCKYRNACPIYRNTTIK